MYPLNYQKAMELFLEAANLGNGEAMNMIGFLIQKHRRKNPPVLLFYSPFGKRIARQDKRCIAIRRRARYA